MITPVLLCGGSGTRLWPLSRKSLPKQFAALLSDESLFQASAKRFHKDGFADPLLVTGDSFRFIVGEQLSVCEITAKSILIEPEGRNTAPAAIAAALVLAKTDPEALMLLVPSDHAVPDAQAFRDAVTRGAVAARAGQIVTFGIAPDRPEIGFGWLESGAETQPGVMTLERFIEKPDLATAQELLADKRYLWNAGVFLARADVMIDAFRTHAPDVLAAVEPAIDKATCDLDFTRIDPEAWAHVPDISIDYAVMEKARNVSVVRFDGKWSDLGSWEAVWQDSPRDAQGNALSDNATAV